MKIKKCIVFMLIFINIVSITQLTYADDIDLEEENDTAWIYDEIETAGSTITDEPIINSRSAVIYDRVSGEVIWGKDENSQRKMASTTKIMTAIVVIENTKNMQEVVTVSKKAAGIGGSTLGLHNGDKISVQDLLYGLMLKSGNDCAIALAEYVGNSVDNFAEMMNIKARELGLKKTHFVTVNGLDDDNHYTTAFELAKMTDYALKIEMFKNIVGCKSYTVTVNGYGRTIGNTNELLGNLDGVYGVKTGFTNGANRCLVTSIKRGNMDTICVVLGADTKKDRTRDSIKVIEYTYSNYEMVKIEKNIEEAFNKWKEANKILTIKGQQEYIEVELGEYNIKEIPIHKQDTKDIEVKIDNLLILDVPIEKGRKVGEVKLKVKGKTKICIDIRTSKDVKKKNIDDYFKEMLRNMNYYFEDFLFNRSHF